MGEKICGAPGAFHGEIPQQEQPTGSGAGAWGMHRWSGSGTTCTVPAVEISSARCGAGRSRATRRRGGDRQGRRRLCLAGVRPRRRSRGAGGAPRGASLEGRAPPGSTRHGAWRAARAARCGPVGGGAFGGARGLGLFCALLAVPPGGRRERPPSRTAIVATDSVVTSPCRQPPASSPAKPPRSPRRLPLFHTPPPLLASASWHLCCRPCRGCLRRPPPPPPVCVR